MQKVSMLKRNVRHGISLSSNNFGILGVHIIGVVYFIF